MTCLCVSCHFRTLLPFTCIDDSCLSPSCTRAAIPTTVFLWVSLALSAFTPAAASSLFFDRARLDSDMCARIDRSSCLVKPSHSLSHSCFPRVWHHFIGCRSRLFIVSLCLPPLLSRGALHLALHLWTDVWSFCTSILSVLPSRGRRTF